jgi:hypothetical protein
MSDGGTVMYACVALYRSDISKTEPKADLSGAHIISNLRPI